MEIYQKNLNSILSKSLKYWYVPERVPLSDWSNNNFYLSAESSSEQGDWECLPYQKEILDCLGDDSVPYITMIKSARTGYTKMLCILVASAIAVTQRSMLVVQPTLDDAKGFSKDEINPMLRDVKCLKGLMGSSRGDATVLKKSFIGGTLDIIGAHSPRGFRRLTKDIVLFDEIDAYKITDEGCPIKLGEKRLMSAPFPKYVYGSTPGNEGESNVKEKWEQSDQRHYHVPCPHCNEKQYLVWREDGMEYGLTYNPEDPNDAYYICKNCACKIEEKDKWEMIKNGEWIAEKPFAGHAGFHIWAAYSPFPKAAWGELAKEYELSKHDNELKKTFYNTVLGETWEDDAGDKLEWEQLFTRREHYQLEVPDPVKILTVGIDTQDDRFEWEIIGWGTHEESWGIEYGVLHGDPRRPEIWKALADKMRRSFKKADGTMLNIAFGCMDQGGHHADRVNQFSREIGEKFIIPIFGAKMPDKPVANFPAKKNSKGTYRMEVGVSMAKDIWYSRYKLYDVGAGYCHYPVIDCYNETYFRGATAEYKKKKMIGGKPQWRWHCPDGVRNEATDCRSYALAAIRVLQQNFGVSLQPEEQKQVKRQRNVRRLT